MKLLQLIAIHKMAFLICNNIAIHQISANKKAGETWMSLGKQHMSTLVPGPLPPTRETHVEFLTPGSNLAQPGLLRSFGEWTHSWKILIFFFSSLCFSNKQTLKKKSYHTHVWILWFLKPFQFNLQVIFFLILEKSIWKNIIERTFERKRNIKRNLATPEGYEVHYFF